MSGPGVFQKSAENYDPRGRLDPAGFVRNVQFRTVPPHAALAPYVEHFWIIRWEGIEGTYHSAEVMHRPYVDIFVGADAAGIQGTFRGKRVYEASGTGRILGARFLPGAFHAFWQGELSNLQDQMLPLARLFPGLSDPGWREIAALDDEAALAVLSDMLVALDPRPDPNIALLNAILAAIEADEALTTVSAVSEKAGYSERWIQQLFRDYLGVGLKWFLQRRRLLAAAEHIRAMEQPDWPAIAYDLGYSSQQHFITDFRQVTGQTPLQYKAGLTR